MARPEKYTIELLKEVQKLFKGGKKFEEIIMDMKLSITPVALRRLLPRRGLSLSQGKRKQRIDWGEKDHGKNLVL